MENQVSTKSNKARQFTRSEGGLKVPVDFEITEHEILTTEYKVEKKEVYSKIFKSKITSRVVKISKHWVHALFFEDGKVYDVRPEGFKIRELQEVVIV